MISLLDFPHMMLHVVLFFHDMGFSRCDNVFSLDLPFLDSHGVMGSHFLVEMDSQMDLKLSEVDIQKK